MQASPFPAQQFAQQPFAGQQQFAQQPFPGQPQQILSAPPSTVGEAPKEEIRIVGADTGTAFFVLGAHGNEEIKKLLKELGGSHNTHMQGYRFQARDLDKVCKALGLVKSINVVDPATMIHVEFTQALQWPGKMSDAETMLKASGLTKKSGGKNAWTGDLSKYPEFARTFNITAAAPK